MLKQTGRPLCLCFDPPDAQNIMRDWLGDDIAFQAQDGNDLGEKMANAFAAAFASGVERAVLIGTDTPDLSTKIIVRAFFALTDHDVVIGPAADGGYYLIGFRSDTFCHAVFESIPWSKASVYTTTLARLSAYGASVYRLPEWRDIDHYADLCALARLLALNESSAPATAAFLKETGICSIGNRTGCP
jgi:rSAM/selenodomain-associated transferase 1